VKVLALVLLLCALALFPAENAILAMDWPSDRGVILKNFGWNDEGMPQLGVSFEADGLLEAADSGELLFHRREGDTASRLPSPLGSWAAIDHGDGIISIYSRFGDMNAGGINTGGSPDGVNSSFQGKIEKGEVLGEAGISGWSSRNGFYFQLFDRREKRWINPSLIITSFSSEDTRAPTVMAVRLRDSQGQVFNPFQTRTLNQGRYTVTVDAYDNMRSQSENPLAPSRIICSLNGSETGALNFETYSAWDGSLMAYRNGLVPARKVYAPFPAYEISDLWLSRGQTNLEIIVQDISGNVRNVAYRLMIE
jgi:hypothetical protein